MLCTLARRRPLSRRAATVLILALAVAGWTPAAAGSTRANALEQPSSRAGTRGSSASGSAGPTQASPQNPPAVPVEIPDDPWARQILLVAGAITAGVLVAAWLAGREVRRNRAAKDSGPFTLDPPGLSFGLQQAGIQATRQVAIINRGPGEATISSVTLSGRGFSTVSPPALPVTLPSGGRLAIDVRFEAAGPCRCSGRLKVRTTVEPRQLEVRLSARVR